MKKLFIICGLIASLSSLVTGQDAEGLRVLNSALRALGGESGLKSVNSIFLSARGLEHRSTDAQGYHPDRQTTAPHEERLAVFSDGKRLAYEYKTGRHDGTTRWRRIYFTDAQRIVADFTTGAVFPSAARFPSADRNKQSRRIPHALLLEVLANSSTLKYAGTRDGQEIISVQLPSAKSRLRLYFDRQTFLLGKYEYTIDFPALGETTAEYLFADYRPHDKLKWFPAKHSIRLDGKIWRTMDFERVEVDSAEAEAMFNLPPELEGFVTPPGTVKEIAQGVYLVFGIGGSYQPMFIEFRDFVVAVEAPALHPGLEETPVESLADPDSLSVEFIARIKQTVKNKPIKYVVPTHYHSDHAGGIRAFAAENAIVLTTPGNERFYEKFAPKMTIDTFEKRKTISDGERTVELIDVGENPHTAENIVVYLPREKYLYQGDLFYFNGEATFPPKDRLTVMPFFAEWLKKNNLAPVRIYGFHSTLFATMEHIEKILELKK
jgi:glyoxylase-like metal-dependent hydrolase (beta-lactamase superfamily II)